MNDESAYVASSVGISKLPPSTLTWTFECAFSVELVYFKQPLVFLIIFKRSSLIGKTHNRLLIPSVVRGCYRLALIKVPQ